MTNYTKQEDYAIKDTLLTGDPEKVVSGEELDTEFSTISTAVNSKIDDPVTKSANQYLQFNGSSWVASTIAPASTMPVGSIIMYAVTFDMGDFLLCDGRPLSNAPTSPYYPLWQVIGVTYGAGAGTFLLPDLRGRAPFGTDFGGAPSGRLAGATYVQGSYTQNGSNGGQVAITSTPAHTHAAGTLDVGGSGSISGDYINSDTLGEVALRSAGGSTSGTISSLSSPPGINISSLTVTGSTASAGSASVDVMNPFMLVNFLIKYQ